MIKAVLFDAAGVLHLSDSVFSTIADDLRQTLGLSEEQATAVLTKYVRLLGTGKISERQVWAELRRDYGIREVSEDEQLLARSFQATLKKMPGMYELVDHLKAIGITVALLTNVTPQFAAVLEREGHYKPFDFKILSYQVGFWKPDPNIYRQALHKLGVQANEAVFIDDQERNVEAAERLGMQGIVFHDTAQVTERLRKLIDF